MTYKRAANDEGIFDAPRGDLFHSIVDSTTPQSRRDLVDQAFLTNAGLGDPTTEASPPAVNPSLRGNLRNADPVDLLPEPARTTDEMGDGMGERDVLAAYQAGRRDAMRKYAKQISSATNAANGPRAAAVSAAAARKPAGTISPAQPMPSIGGEKLAPASIPSPAVTRNIAPPSPTQGLKADGVGTGVAGSQQHGTAGTNQLGTSPAAQGAATSTVVSSAQVFANTPIPGKSTPPSDQKRAALNDRSDYGRKEPQRYSIPEDNGQNYSPRKNLDEQPDRRVGKAFNDLNGQRNADTLNEMGQASIGVIG